MAKLTSTYSRLGRLVYLFPLWLATCCIATAQWVDPQTPTNAQPVSGSGNWALAFSDEFNTNTLDTAKWGVDVSASSRAARTDRGIDDWWWKSENVSLDGSNLVLTVSKHDANTMYCGSVSSDGLYEPMYGYLEARINIADSTKDTHTAFWLQGANMSNVDGTAHDGAEVDIFESAWFGDTTKSVVHIDGYGVDHQANTKQYNTAGLHTGYHVFGLEWTSESMKIYYDGDLKVTYTGTWVPQTNEWIWLSDGASFGDIGTFTNEANGYLTDAKFDYVRVWQAASNAPPVFDTDPILKPFATVDAIYSNTIFGSASDPESDPMVYAKESGPTWLNIATNGTLLGTPSLSDEGTNNWIISATDTNGGMDTATLTIEVSQPSNDPIILVGGALLNGDFNNPDMDASFAELDSWFNMGTAAQTVNATKNNNAYDGSRHAVLGWQPGAKLYTLDTGYTIQEGDSFDFSYVWKDGWLWNDGTHEVMVSLFVTSDNTTNGTPTNLVSDLSGTSTQDNTYESVDSSSVYTASPSDDGKRLFVQIDTTIGGEAYATLDNFELIVTPMSTNAVYTVTYDANTSTSGNLPVDTNNYAVSNTVIVLGNTGNLANASYSFSGWNTAPNGSGIAYTADDTFSMPANDVTLYAQYAGAPTWSDEFNGTGAPDPSSWWLEEGYQRNNEEQYYMTNGSAWQADGTLIIEGRRETTNGYDYTSASLRSRGLYSWQYGRAQIRAKIPCLPGMWPAIWMVGDTGEWPSNGECDILEYKGTSTPKIFSNCARATTTRWNAAWDSVTRNVADLVAVDPNWENEYHIWTIQWDEQNVRLYVDNILMNTTPQSWLVNPVTTWGPLEPFKQPHSLWLNLAIGAGGGDPSSVPFPQRYYVDYWRVWEGATDNVAPTDITLSTNAITELLPAGTAVGYLSASDSDPSEVIRYSLVSGTGADDNALFTIPEFLSDNTTTGVLQTASELVFTNGATRSIRVRATDIEGATFDKVLVINVIDNPDEDDDGLLDAWELENFGSITNSAGLSTEDQDGDGFIDLHEFLAGTSPTNANSVFALAGEQPGIASNQLVLSWYAVSNKSYMILSADDLSTPAWTTNASAIPGVEPLCVHTVLTSGAESYYLLRLEE